MTAVPNSPLQKPVFTAWLWINFKIGALSVGSASRILLFEEELQARGWLTQDEFTEALTLAQVLPGPNLVNLAACLGCRFFPTWQGLLAIVPLVLPGAAIAVAVAAWVPLEQPDVTALFRGFAIGAFLLMGKFIWNLLKGLSVRYGSPERPYRVKRIGRYVIGALMATGVFLQLPMLPLIAGGVAVCLAWEFLR